MRYIFLSLALSTGLMAALLALAPNASSDERTNSAHPMVVEVVQPAPPANLNLPTVKTSNSAQPAHCWARLAQLLTALDSKQCS